MKDDQQNYWQPQDEAEAPQGQEQPRLEAIDKVDAAEKTSQPTSSTGKASAPTPQPPRIPSEITWEASDAVEHAKGPLWFIVIGAVALVLVAAMVFLRQWTFAALVLVMTITLMVFARRPTRVARYILNDVGLSIDGKIHYYTDFRAFGVIHDDALFALKLIPTKRFSPEIMVYFAEKDGELIVDILGSHLPMEEMKLDLADRIIRKIRL